MLDKKKILVLTDFYYPVPTSIGICTEKITGELVNRGAEVEVLCFGKTNKINAGLYKEVKLHYVKKRIWDRFYDRASDSGNAFMGRLFQGAGILLQRTSQLIFMPFFPLTSLTVPRRFYKMARRLMLLNRYDIILATYAPFEALWSGFQLKKEFQNTRFVTYILDTLSNRGKSKYFSAQWNEKQGFRWEKKIFPAADANIVMKCHELHHQHEKYDFCRDKIMFGDIPLFDRSELTKACALNDAEKCEKATVPQLVYAGRVLSHLSNPEYLCELFAAATQQSNGHMLFYSQGDCEEYLKSMQEKTGGRIERKGFVPREEAVRAMQQADILVSIGCTHSEKIPSKIFDYISLGKKILHIKQSQNDSAVSYYEKYPLALILSVEDDFYENVRKLISFMEEKDLKLDPRRVIADFELNTAQSTALIVLAES